MNDVVLVTNEVTSKCDAVKLNSSANHFTSDQKLLFVVSHILVYLFHAILCYYSLKIIISCSFHHCCQRWSFSSSNCDITTVDLWCHAKPRHWYCDIIFTDCFACANWLKVILLKLDWNWDVSACVTLKFNGWPRKKIGYLFYTTSSFVHHSNPSVNSN